MASSALSRIYDALFQFEAKGQQSSYPIHKKITIDGQGLLTWLLQQLSVTSGMRILDAGCGTGHTLFTLAEARNIEGVGLSLSPQEVRFAQDLTSARGLDSQLDFLCRDMAAELEDLGSFDLIFGIESLKHCEDPTAVLKNLLARLRVGGVLVLLDDFLQQPSTDDRVSAHQRYWQAPGFTTVEQLLSPLSKDWSYETKDLTAYVPAKSPWIRSLLLTGMGVLKRLAKKGGVWRTNLETYQGALLLESLYQAGVAGYHMIRVKAA